MENAVRLSKVAVVVVVVAVHQQHRSTGTHRNYSTETLIFHPIITFSTVISSCCLFQYHLHACTAASPSAAGAGNWRFQVLYSEHSETTKQERKKKKLSGLSLYCQKQELLLTDLKSCVGLSFLSIVQNF